MLPLSDTGSAILVAALLALCVLGYAPMFGGWKAVKWLAFQIPIAVGVAAVGASAGISGAGPFLAGIITAYLVTVGPVRAWDWLRARLRPRRRLDGIKPPPDDLSRLVEGTAAVRRIDPQPIQLGRDIRIGE